MGDPNQIDRPYLDERTNGLSYAAEHMKGSPLCWQVTLLPEECERSVLARMLSAVCRRKASKKHRKEHSDNREKNKEKSIYDESGIILVKFNERVLNEAGNPKVPLAERLTFVSIYQSN